MDLEEDIHEEKAEQVNLCLPVELNTKSYPQHEHYEVYL